MLEQGYPPRIFAYANYRDYLRDFLAWAKTARPELTHRAILSKLGVTSTGFLANVLSGKSNLNAQQSRQLAEVLELQPAETRFFQTLAAFTQARGLEEKAEALDSLRAQARARNKQLDPRQYSLFTKWFYPLVFELAGLGAVSGDPGETAARIGGGVKADDVRRALEALEALGLVQKDEAGRYGTAHGIVRTGDEIASADVVQYQAAVLRKAIEALEGIGKEDRSITATTLPLTRAGLERAKLEAQAFRDRLLALSEEEPGADRVYFLSVNIFPGTRPPQGAAE